MNEKLKQSRGITLIETIVAIFIFTTGIVSIVVTTIYTFTAQDKLVFKMTALGLAREGTEVVRSVRDGQWISLSVANGGPDYCGNDDPGGSDLAPEQYCYKNWLDWYNALTDTCLPVGCKQIQAVFDPEFSSWSLDSALPDYPLYLQADGSYLTGDPGGVQPFYYRKIKITQNSNEPYTTQNPELSVVSTVAWVGRGCAVPPGGDPESAVDTCKVVVEDRLTNWKNY
ncbi:MAG: hypothetical protein A3J48_02300 [Candidatus Doudnabacteria bacterium RIFCSPHIGHO2_02_FULL_46_11]|uniref:Type II secretion system protein n=1 Tax=Candidatus Doudnabacteria bacterium RIFCSPHIGHO2_02_FULL_46_11 TaxID=1817832 RepID=A0A1F5P875_9BACT|nr:MAG: hypothetical protein A3J48_02300 [Candidatus Doudnabacteria bacterium RIFCSPHIGHO2_02_FULL_46_11]